VLTEPQPSPVVGPWAVTGSAGLIRTRHFPANFPFAGAELSGVGVGGSAPGLDSYSDIQTRYVAA